MAGPISPLGYLLLVVVVVALVLWLGAKTSRRIDRVVTRVALVAFGGFVVADTERERIVEAAYIDETYRTYAAKTLLFTTMAGGAGAVAGSYLMIGLLAVLQPLVRKLAQLPSTIAFPLGFRRDFVLSLSKPTVVTLLFVAGLVLGGVLALLAYAFRWKLPESNAEVRRRSIDEGLPRTAAFMYALSRGGMEFPQVVRILSDHREVYGETAKEMSVSVREMDLFGRDMISAVRRMARRTPSEQFKTFSENLASVLQSGSDLPDFLREQYERFQAEAEERQESILELLATIAEGYVTVMVAGVLFLITILLVFGLTTTDTLWLLQGMAYLLIPLANVGFVVFLAQKLEALGISRESGSEVLERLDAATPVSATPPPEKRRADGGVTADDQTLAQLSRYDRLKRVKDVLRSPLRTVVWNPTTVLYLAVPVAVLVFLVRLPEALLGTGLNLRVLDDLVVQSLLLVLVSYAVVREVYKRRIDRIEAAMPELLERLASLNEAGMTVYEGFDRVRGSDLGVLTPEVDRIWRDVEYGANVDDALVRFGRRVRTTAVTRVVTLLTNALRASGELGSVLRIAATQARADLRMRRQRRRQMLTYLVVIYVAFFVFLVIIIAVQEVLVPSLPESVPTPAEGDVNRLGVNADQFARLGQVDKAAYTLVFFHTALVQAVCSGFIGGQLGEGTLKDGAKHAAAMLAIAYVVFILVSSPVSSIAASEAVSTGEDVHVGTVSMSAGGYVAVYDDTVNGTMLGHSEYIEPGTHEGVVVPLDREIRDNRTVTIVTHRDTNGNQVFDFQGPYVTGTGQVDPPYSKLSNRGTPGVEVEIRYIGEE
ncbi:type II secretion system F family protein [Halobacteriales archaeon Cl-PHB]